MSICNCKHWSYCKIEDKESCLLNKDQWCKPDNKIMGRTAKEINKMQGRDKDLK